MNRKRWTEWGAALLLLGVLWGGERGLCAQERKEAGEPVVHTYALQHGDPKGVREVLRPYLLQSTVGRNPAGGYLVTLTYEGRFRDQIESLIRQMDVPVGRVELDIHTLVASRKEIPGGAAVPGELRPVVEKMKGVIQFQHLSLDGVSHLQVSGSEGRGEVLLGSRFFHAAVGTQLRFSIWNALVARDDGGCRLTGELRVRKESVVPASGKVSAFTELLESQLRIPCDGYFVGGISSLGTADQALVLIIRARLV